MLTYAEIHYHPRFVPSLIYTNQPEIIFDAPYRIQTENPIPVFIIIKDADLFPVQLDSVVIHIIYEGGDHRISRFPYSGLNVNSKIWWDSINIIPEYPGIVKIDSYMYLTVGGKGVSVHIDNYRGISHSPLNVFVASSDFPGCEGWYHGDIHCHTYYTSDQIEFGAPLEVMAFSAFCMGLQWMVATDHSYDLDDCENCYSSNDPLLMKWRMMRKKAELLVESLSVIPGEEVTCRTQKGQNCHLLAINSNKFIMGSGDSGENSFKTKTEKSIGEAVSECMEWGGFACAAHPLEKIPLLEKFFLGRGKWTFSDLETPGIKALQFYNGIRDKGFRDGMNSWIKLLLNGRRIYTFGGNDAHGDLNRSRYVWLPLMFISEGIEHVFGNVRTVVRAMSKSTIDIIEALNEGHAVVTDGPFINLELVKNNVVAHPGDEITAGKIGVNAKFISSSEFGFLKKTRIIFGIKGEKAERILLSHNLSNSEFEYIFKDSFEINNLLYIRADCETALGKICFTNPIWIADK